MSSLRLTDPAAFKLSSLAKPGVRRASVCEQWLSVRRQFGRFVKALTQKVLDLARATAIG
jgi:hypothetical protein